MAHPELRCATQTLERGVDPIGTATTYAAYVLVEVPLPWPAAITDHPVLVDLVAAVDAGRAGLGTVQVLGVVPEGDEPGQHRVIVYRRPTGPFRRFHRAERSVSTIDLAVTAIDLLTAEPTVDVVDDNDDRNEVVADLLICTHGRRDRCCGSFGTNLFTAVGVRHSRAGIRTWRVSHTGGHRFAPTAIVLPEGHLWSHLDVDLVEQILHRRGEVTDVLDHYRGSSAIGGPPVQVAEREAFRREGWTWLDCFRSGSITGPNDNGDEVEVRLEFTRPDGSAGAYLAALERVGTVAQPVCGEAPTSAGNGKSDSIWILTRFDPVEPPLPG